MTEAELSILKDQWAEYPTLPSPPRKSHLTPDQEWARCNAELIKYMKNGDWGLYCNTRADMAALHFHQGRLHDSLVAYLEVIYLDLNGPNNTGGCRDRELLREYPPFSARDGFLAPGIVDLAFGVAFAIDTSPAELEALFLETATALQERLRLPVSPHAAWKRLNSV